MRLVQVRDLLAGQGWLDLTQARLDPPQGGFLDQLAQGRVPGWLRPAEPGGGTALRIFRVLGP